MTHREREEQWRRFHAWEAERLRSAPPELASAMAWMWDAWQLAAKNDPSWGSRESAEEHWRHLAAVRAALARMRPAA